MLDERIGSYRRAAVLVLLGFLFQIFCGTNESLAQTTQAGDDIHAGHVHAASESTSFFSDLLKVYTPRQVCMLNEQPVIWLHLVSDALIGVSYFSIPLALVALVRRRRDLAFHWMFWMFAAFIVACGATHFFGLVALWKPYYRMDGIIKAITALLSVATAISLWPLIPRIASLPSASKLDQLVKARTTELEQVNVVLRREIEARQLAERDQARLAAIVEHSRDAIIGKTLTGIVTSWNQAAEQLFGYSSDEMLGQSVLRLVPLELREEEEQILSRLARGEIIPALETVRQTKGGSRIDVVLTVSPIKDRNGVIIGASKITRDVTIQKQYAREREQLLASERLARIESDRASRMKDEFLATVSHELRTPLTAMLGWSQILRRNPTAAALEDGLQTIERNARAQAKLVEDLLDMSRIISGKLRLEVTEVDLAQVINEATLSVEPAAAAKEIRLQKILDPNTPPVSGDAARLQQVVWNLLTNAVKFTPRGGRVQIFLERSGSHVDITVTDTGEGLNAAFIPHLFERFRQADSSLTRRHGGLGIGLAIVRHLVEQHGGRVEASSPGADKGSTFSIKLPIHPVSIIPHQAAWETKTTRTSVESSDTIHLEGLRVLVVDDEPDTSDLVRRVLEPIGATVVTAGSAAEGYELVQKHLPDVMLCDIGMPQEDGYSLLRRVRKLASANGGDVPAIAVTAFARVEDQQRAFLAGFHLHIAKPFEAADLIDSIARVTGRIQTK